MLQMKKIIEFTKSWKYRNLLHVVCGLILGLILNLIVSWYISILAVIAFANYWEFCQKKYFGAKYSISDILLTTISAAIQYSKCDEYDKYVYWLHFTSISATIQHD